MPTSEVNYLQLAPVVRRRREQLGMTQAEAAVKADVSVSTWRTIEGDSEARPRGLTLSAIASALGWSIDQLSNMTRGEPADVADPVPAEIAALSGKLNRLSEKDRRYVEDLVERLLGEES